MKAFQISGVEDAAVVDIENPGLPGRDEVLVKVRRASLCGTDIKTLSGTPPPKKYPIILGHEGYGDIQEIGEAVSDFKSRERVIFDEKMIDFSCRECRRGKFNFCIHGGLRGRDVDGLLAEEIVVNQRLVYHVPDTIDPDIIPLIQPLATVVHAQRMVDITPSDNIVVIGLGATGLMHAKMSKLRGANVIGISRSDQKLELSTEFGVDNPIKSSVADVEREVERLTDGTGADIVIDAAGDPSLVNLSLQLLRKGGSLLQFSISSQRAELELYGLYSKEMKIIGSRGSVPSDYLASIEMVSRNQFPMKKLVTHTYDFEGIPRALASLRNKGEIKPMVRVS